MNRKGGESSFIVRIFAVFAGCMMSKLWGEKSNARLGGVSHCFCFAVWGD